MAFSIHHYGIVSNDLDSTMAAFCKAFNLTAPDYGVFDDRDTGIKFTIVPMAGGNLEFLQPSGEGEGDQAVHGQKLRDALAARGEGSFQLAMYSDDYDADIADLKEKGFTVDEYSIDFVMDSKVRMAFMDPNQMSGMLIELIDAAGAPEGMK